MRTLELLALVQIVCLSVAYARVVLDGCGQPIRSNGGKRQLSEYNPFALGSFSTAGFGSYPPVYLHSIYNQPATASLSKGFEYLKGFDQFPGFENFKTHDTFKGFGGLKPVESLISTTGKAEVFPPVKAEAYKTFEIDDGLGSNQGYKIHENAELDHKLDDLHHLEETHRHESLHKHIDDHKHKADHKHQHKHHEQHKHQHKEEHKHGHKHKEQHKHGHQHKQVHHHKHEDVEHHHHQHKHVQHHHHMHKHVGDHQHKHKEEHKHGHKHHEGHQHGHKHLEQHHEEHKHGHKHEQDHLHGHKHEEEHMHLEEHKHGHKHGHKHNEKHSHGHKYGHRHHESYETDGSHAEYQYRYLGKNKSPLVEDLQEDRSNQQYSTAYIPPKRQYDVADSDQQPTEGTSDSVNYQSNLKPVVNIEPQSQIGASISETYVPKLPYIHAETLYRGMFSP